MTKLEKELRRREERRINSINKAESDLAEDALRVLWNVVLIMIGVVIGLMLSASRFACHHPIPQRWGDRGGEIRHL